MSRQVWATYSVKDHLHPRALAADIMLFDRLVFPVPEIGDIPYQDTGPDGRGPVIWSQNPVEWKRWEDENWNPTAQALLLEMLAPVVRKVPWDIKHREAWRKEFSEAADKHLPDYAFFATRSVLTSDLPAYVDGVEAMGPAYRSVKEMQKEIGVKQNDKEPPLPGSALSRVLGWEFLAPSDGRLSDKELLEATVAFVTGDSDFQRRRMKFWNWQQQFLNKGKTDCESIDAAVSEMRQLLEEQKAAAKRLPLETTVRYAFRIAPPVLGLTALIPGAIGIVAGVAGGVFLSFVQTAAEKWSSKKAVDNEPSPAAFVHDARRHFGWD
jgi:hypothetical protein